MSDHVRGKQNNSIWDDVTLSHGTTSRQSMCGRICPSCKYCGVCLLTRLYIPYGTLWDTLRKADSAWGAGTRYPRSDWMSPLAACSPTGSPLHEMFKTANKKVSWSHLGLVNLVELGRWEERWPPGKQQHQIKMKKRSPYLHLVIMSLQSLWVNELQLGVS